MTTTSRRSLRNAQSGVMLLEALIGILIFSLGILAMVGMQAMGIKLATDSRDRAEASNLATQLVGEMWLNRAALASYQYTGTGTAPAALTTWIAQVDASLPDAAANPPIVTVGASSLGAAVGTQTTVTLRWRNPTDTTVHQFVMTAYIN
ncbi:MAG: type IV pilus modification protein PilV [Betaproteobacteria bacterium]|nr:type IV pilus modification protein PilV [Betaproteobacteria bacterium]